MKPLTPTQRPVQYFLGIGIFALAVVSLLVLVAALVRSAPPILGHMALRAVDRGDFVAARRIAGLSLRIIGPQDTALLALDASFQRPLLASERAGDYDAVIKLSTEWESVTQGRNAEPFCWKALGYLRKNNLEDARDAYLQALRVHNCYPSEQRIGFLQVLVAATNVIREDTSDLISIVSK